MEINENLDKKQIEHALKRKTKMLQRLKNESSDNNLSTTRIETIRKQIGQLEKEISLVMSWLGYTDERIKIALNKQSDCLKQRKTPIEWNFTAYSVLGLLILGIIYGFATILVNLPRLFKFIFSFFSQPMSTVFLSLFIISISIIAISICVDLLFNNYSNKRKVEDLIWEQILTIVRRPLLHD